MNKQQFLEKLLSEQQNWEQFLAAIPAPLRSQQNFYGRWRVIDVIGHVAAWERYMTGRLSAHLRGDRATPSELWGEFVPPSDLADDALNNWMAEQLAGRSFDAILGMQHEVRSQLIATIEAAGEEMLTTVGLQVKGLPYHENDPFWQVIASMSYEHGHEHLHGLREALAQQQVSKASIAEQAVSSLYHRLLQSWNQQDAIGMGDLYRADASVVGFDGSQMNGREEIVATIGNIFTHHRTASYVGKVREVRLLNDNSALLRAVVGMIPPGGSDINPAVNAIQSLVAIRENDIWQVALFHNTPAAFHGRPEASEALTNELRALLP